MIDDDRRQTLQRELDEAVKQRDDLDAAIRYLRGRLGLGVETDGDDQRQGLAVGTDIVASVSPNQFHGRSVPQAARALLERVGRDRPLKTDEIFKALKKGGVKVGSEGAVYRSLFRDVAFHNTGRGFWGLAVWYPGVVRKNKGQPNPQMPEVIAEASPEKVAKRVADTEVASKDVGG